MHGDEPQLPVALQHGLGRRPVLHAKATMGRVQYSTARALVYRLLKAMPMLEQVNEWRARYSLADTEGQVLGKRNE